MSDAGRRGLDRRARRALAVAGMLTALAGCRGPGWQAGPALLAPPRLVAVALGDRMTLADLEAFDPRAVPDVPAPQRLRPCCAFGVDLDTGVPGVRIGNLTDVAHLGPHEYNNGLVTIQADPRRGVVLERNALVYTCRGGFIDLAHVRDNADLTLFLTMRLAKVLTSGVSFDLPADGGERRVVLRPVPEALALRLGRIEAALRIAQWLAFQLSVWHEISTWYGGQSIPGFSERVSSFSPEDAYSNLVGIRLAGGLIRAQGARTREGYNHAMDAWIAGGLRRLGAVPEPAGRAAMKAVDGIWWDSRRTVRDFELVLRRDVAVRPPLTPWQVPAARWSGAAGEPCQGAGPLVLDLADRLEDQPIAELATVSFTVAEGLRDAFPLPEARARPLTPADFPAIAAAIRAALPGQGADPPRPLSLR